MIRKTRTVTNLLTGEEVQLVELIPETPEDHDELERLHLAGLLDDDDAFSDRPEAWEE